MTTAVRSVLSAFRTAAASQVFLLILGIFALALFGAPTRAAQTVLANYGDDSLLTVDLATGNRTVLSGSTAGTGQALAEPVALVLDTSGHLYVGENQTGGILVVDVTTGNRSALLNPGSVAYSNIYGLALDGQGNLIAACNSAVIYQINTATGACTTLASPTIGTGAAVGHPGGVILDTDGTIIYSDFDSNLFGLRLVRLNPATLVRTEISSATMGTGDLGTGHAGMITKLPNGSLAVAMYQDPSDYIIAVDPATGNRTVLSGTSVGTGTAFVSGPYALAEASDGTLFASDFFGNALFSIDPTTGNRTVLSSAAIGMGNAINEPLGMLGAVVASVTSVSNTPTVTAISPAHGPAAGGTSVTITGTGFTGATAVTIGGTAATGITVVNDTSITATTPAGTAGTASVLVTTTNGTNVANTLYTYGSGPTVTAVSPSSGPAAGGTSVTITGTGFAGATAVTIGGTAATGVTVVNNTSITATTPAGTAGTASVLVTTTNGTNAANNLYTYVAAPTITSITPTAGPLAGGTSVTITGTNFLFATALTFGGTSATGVTVVSATSITATAPAGTSTVDVRVTTGGGTSGTSSADHYTFASVPTVTGLSTGGGPLAGSTSVTLTGANFIGVTAVNFGGTPATSFTVISATSISAVTPAGTSGAVDVTVIAAGGTSTTGSSDRFSYTTSPIFASGTAATGTFGVAYTGSTLYQAVATGATSFSVTSGTLPPGLALDGSSGNISGTPTQAGSYTVTLSASNLGGSTSLGLTLTIQKATASITLVNPAAQFDGTPKTVGAVTTPSGLPVTITYGGSPVAPTLSGVYAIVATVNTTNYSGSQTGTFVISQPLVQTTFQGSFIFPTPTTSSSGLRPAAVLTGSIAASINATRTSGTIIGAAGNSAFVVTISIGSNGSFSGSTTALTVPGSQITGPLTFTGTLSGSTLAGSIAPLGASFSLPADAAGSSAAIAGYYQASSLDSATGSTYSIVGTQGNVLVVAVSPTAVISGTGTVAADNSFVVTTAQGAAVTGSVNPSTTTVALTITTTSGTTNYSGVASTTARTDRLINLSSRGAVSGSNVLVSGLVIGGSSSKTVLLRAVGPGLSAFNVAGVLAHPHLQLFNATGQIISDSAAWNASSGLSTVFAQLGAFPLTTGSADSAVEMSLTPGTYTLQVSNNGTDAGGIALAEIYDASANPAMEYQRLINISTRAFVSSGAANLTGGFVVTGNTPKQVLIRGIGPGLAVFGVSNVLADPTLTVFDGTGSVVAQNDNWGTPIIVTAGQTVASAADITAADLATAAFPLTAGSKDAALIVTLPPGSYTAQVTGVGGATGTALVEIYEIP